MEEQKRVNAITSEQLRDCMESVPSTLVVDLQLAWDGVSLAVVLWCVGRLIWDMRHRHAMLFPLDR